MTDEIKALFRITGPDLDTDEIVVGRQGLRAGRGADNSLVLNHREISRQHMRVIWREDDTYLIEDLNSSNGVYFNETRIPSRVPQELNIGDVIRAGPFTLTLERLIYAQRSVAAQRAYDGEVAPLPALDADVSIGHPMGVPRDKSSWLQYLPSIAQLFFLFLLFSVS